MNRRDPCLPKSVYWRTEGFWVGFRVVSPLKEPSEAEKLRYWNADDPVTEKSTNRHRDRQEVIERPAK